MKIDEFASVLRMPVEDMVSIGEKQALNPSSQIYKSIKLEVGKKFAAVKAASDVDKRKRVKNRVYIQHVVSTNDRYVFTSTFPQWEIKFANAGLRSASTARAVYALMTEYLFEKVRTSKGRVIAWGTDMRSIVMRSRDWVHLCVPGHEMSAQYEFTVEDRSILAMVNAACSRGRDPGLPKKYALGQHSVHCTTPVRCRHQASAAVMMLHKTDTNFRQIATYMVQHGVKLLYFVIPGGKHLELATQGPLPDLDAFSHPSSDGQRIDIVYKNDMTLGQSFTYSNYLELVARTELRAHGMIFRKEIDNSLLGTLCYKVTCFPDDPGIKSSPVVYRSWIEPKHASQYMVYAPVLSSGGQFSNYEDWQMVTFPVPRDLLDEVHDAAMRAQGIKDLMGFIARRLNSKTSTTVILNQVVQRNKLLAVTKFDLLVLVIYCSVFMRKYSDGQTIATLAPHAREVVELGKHGMLGMFSVYARALFSMGTSQLSEFVSSIRKFYYTTDTYSDLPLPAFLLEPGFIEYSDTASSNPRFKSWSTPSGSPAFGFSQSLPGAEYTRIEPFGDFMNHTTSESCVEGSVSVDPLLLATGQGVVRSQAAANVQARTRIRDRDVELYAEASSAISWMSSVAGYVSRAFLEYPDTEVLYDVNQRDSFKFAEINDGLYAAETRFDSSRVYDKDLQVRPKTFTSSVDEVVDKVLNDNNRLVNINPRLTTTAVFSKGDIPEVIPGFYSDSPIIDMKDGLAKIFPGSMLMNTEFFESDKHYGNFETVLKGGRIKIDLSKLMPLKHERFFMPIISGHIQPDIKTTPMSVLYTLQKRNANTPDSAIPMDEQRMIASAWKAYLQVFCKPGTEQYLESLPYVGPDEEAVREWVSKLPEIKRSKQASQDGYSVNELDLAKNNFMLKGKLKPNLGASYETAVKAPQSIQYDPSGKSTATLSPVIGRKVEREQAVLKPNVLVLQRKSVLDIITFLNGFDWRPDERGARYYLEIDYDVYDKSQGVQAQKLHWYKCAKFGVMPELVKFLEQHNQIRSISALEAGIKMFLDTQRGSGHPDTLDGNNDVNEMVLAELILEFIDRLEFVIIQGDDVILALRGARIDASTWEYEVSRRFNLSMKMSLQEHGYMCSYDIVHLPDGHTVVVADVVKRSLAFLSQSKKNEEDFPEQFVSFVDNMQYIDDIRVQRYLAETLPKRMAKYLPGTTSEAIMLLCKACAKIKTDYKLFRNMFSEDSKLRVY